MGSQPVAMTVAARLWRRGIGVVLGILGLAAVVLGVGLYSVFVYGVHHPYSPAAACEDRRDGQASVHGPPAVTKPGVLPISLRCQWTDTSMEIELISARTTVLPLVIVGIGLGLMVVGGVVFYRAGVRWRVRPGNGGHQGGVRDLSG